MIARGRRVFLENLADTDPPADFLSQLSRNT